MKQSASDSAEQLPDSDPLRDVTDCVIALHACAAEQARLVGQGIHITSLTENGALLRALVSLGRFYREEIIRAIRTHGDIRT